MGDDEVKTRSVVLEVILNMVVEVMVDNDKEFINFFYNDSSSCEPRNILDAAPGCLCNWAHIRYLREATLEEEERWKADMEEEKMGET